MSSKRILITGGNGFLGSHVVEHLLKTTDWEIDLLDKLTYASYGFDRLKEIDAYGNRRVRCFAADVANPIDGCLKTELQNCAFIIHLAAETHVDNSIANPIPFVRSNVLGTAHILQFARECPNLEKMLYFSTDEVFGPSLDGGYKEWDRYDSRNPYSASKAGGEELALAWANTYKVPVFVTHTMNIFGERQHPEKFIPKVIKAVLSGEAVAIHSTPDRTAAGSRFWIHARNVASALLFLLEKAVPRDKYNIVGECEVDNLTLARTIAEIVGKPLKYELVDFHSSRPGHDLRYGLDGTKLSDMGFRFPSTFNDSLATSVRWTLSNPRWLEAV